MKENADFLKYGDFIQLRGKRAKGNGRTFSYGFLLCVGDLIQTVFYNEVSSGDDDGTSWRKLLEVENDSIFQIWPKLETKMHSKFAKINQEVQAHQSVGAQSNSNQIMQAILSNAKESVEKENESNMMRMKKLKGAEVHFGDEIQLYHVRSKSYILATKGGTAKDKSAFKLGLSTWPKNEMCFMIKPRYKIHGDGGFIQYKDEVLLFSNKIKAFLEVSNEGVSESIFEKVQSLLPMFHSLHLGINYRINSAIIAKQNGVLYSKSSGFVWDPVPVQIATKEENDPKWILGNDYIFLQHNETQAYLAIESTKELDSSPVYLRKYVGKFPEEFKTTQCIWQIQILSPSSVERAKRIKTSCSNIILRNYFTGKVLAVGKDMQLCCEPLGKPENDYSAVLKFNPMSWKNAKVLTNDDSYCLLSSNKNVTLTSSVNSQRGTLGNKLIEEDEQSSESSEFPEEEEVMLKKESSSRNKEAGFYKKISTEAEEVKQFFVNLERRSHSSLEDAFKIERVPESDMQLLFFIESSYKTLNEVVLNIKYGVIKSLPQNMTHELSKVLNDLISFVVGLPNGETVKEGRFYKAMPIRQKYLKDMKIIELLMDFVYIPFACGMYHLSEISKSKHVQEAMILAYKLLTFIICDYTPNEFYVAQWMGLLIWQSSESVGENRVGAHEMLTMLIDNNYNLLSHLDRSIIKKIVETLCHENKNQVYVNLVDAMVMCKNQILEWNQEVVSNMLFEGDLYRKYVHLKVELDPERKACIFFDGELVTLSEFAKICKKTNDYRYAFFQSTIKLLGDLCAGRNFKAMLPVREFFSFDYCIEAIQDKKIEYPLRSAFLRLVYTLYIDDNIIKTLYPHCLRLYKKESNEFILESSDEFKGSSQSDLVDFEKIGTVKSFVVSWMDSELGNGVLRAFDRGQNLFILQILYVVKNLVRFGQFSTVDELERLYRRLLGMLDGSSDVMTKEEEDRNKGIRKKRSSIGILAIKNFTEMIKKSRKKEKRTKLRYEDTPDNQLVIEVKIEVLEIFKKLQKVKADMWMTDYLNYFLDFNFKAKKSRKASILKTKRGQIAPEGVLEMASARPSLTQVRPDVNDTPISWLKAALSSDVLDAHQQLCCILMDLMLYKNEQLNLAAFHLFKTQFIKTSTLFSCLNNIYIVENESHFKTLFEINGVSGLLHRLADKCELWITSKDSENWIKSLVTLHLILRGHDSSLHDLHISPDSGLPVKKGISKKYDSFLVLRNCESYSRYMVRLFMFKKGEKGLLTLLSYNSSLKIHQEEQLKIVSKIQFATINTLIILSQINNSMKLIIFERLPVLLRLLKTQVNANVHLLLRVVLENNKRIHDPDFVQDIIENIAKSAQRIMPVSMARAASILSSVDVCLKYKEVVLKRNQTLFLTIISQFPGLLYVLGDSQKMKSLQKNLENEAKRYKDWIDKTTLTDVDGKRYFEVSEKLAFFSSTFSLLTLACEGSNGATESISKKMYSLPDLEVLFKMSRNVPYIKQNIWRFFYNCYLGKQGVRGSDSSKGLARIMDCLKEELKATCVFLGKLVSESQILFAQSYIVDHLGPKQLKTIYVSFLTQILCPIISEASFAGFHQLSDMDELKFSEFIYNSLEALSFEIPSSETSLQESVSTTMDFLLHHLPNLKKSVKKTATLESPPAIHEKLKVKNKSAEQSRVNISATRMSETLQMSKSMPEVEAGWMIKLLKNSVIELEKPRSKKTPPISTLIAREYLKMIKFIRNIEKKSNEVFEEKVKLTSIEIYKGLLKVLKKSEEPSMIMTVTKIFRFIIEDTSGLHLSLNDDHTIADADMDDFSSSAGALKEIQNLLGNIGLMDYLILNFIKYPKRELREQILLSMIALTKGGNQLTQNRFYKIVSSDTSNSFILTLYSFASEVFSEIRISMKMVLRQMQDEFIGVQTKEPKEKSKPVVRPKEPKKSLNMSTIPNLLSPKNPLNFKNVFNAKETEKKEEFSLNATDENFLMDLEEELSSGDRGNFTMEQEKQEEKPKTEEEKPKETVKHNREKRKDIQLIILGQRIFRFMKGMCEGPNRQIQELFREQILNKAQHPNNRNFLKLSSDLFGSFSKFVNMECLDFGSDMIDFFIESIQGPCEPNQLSLCSLKIIQNVQELMNTFPKCGLQLKPMLKRGISSEAQQNKARNLINKSCGGLLLAILEGNDDQKVTKYFEENLNLDILVEKISDEYLLFTKNVLGKSPNKSLSEIFSLTNKLDFFDSDTSSGFSVFVFLSYLCDYSNVIKKDLVDFLETSSPQVQKAFSFFEEYTGRIEVVLSNNKLVPYIFMFHPICLVLSEEKKANILESIGRSTTFEKLNGFLKKIPEVFDEVLVDKKQQKSFSKITESRGNFIQGVSLFIAFLINGLLVYSFVLEYERDKNGENEAKQVPELLKGMDPMKIVEKLGQIQVFFSCLSFLLFLILKSKIIFREYWRSRFLALKPIARAKKSSFPLAFAHWEWNGLSRFQSFGEAFKGPKKHEKGGVHGNYRF